MGSLMGGWNSPVSDPKFVRYQRNLSLTKGEIEAYWKSKKKTEEEHSKAIYSPSPDSSQESTPEDTDKRFERSSSLPLANTQGNLMDINTKTSLETFIKQNAWWTRSNSAFLNEPPVIASSEGEGPANKSYAPEFHVY